MYIQIKQYRLYPLAILLTSLVSSVYLPVYAEEKPYEQTFVVTAYYSPLPGQSAYFRGSYEEDIAFNGKGTNGADGTDVYTGMIAAPDSYAFGTRIDLPGLGVGTVHDRGGRIIEWGDDIHRIDIWMGKGEEGLSRALAWGARRVKGTVYPSAFVGAPVESLALDSIPADTSILASLPKNDPLEIMTHAKLGEATYAVRLLQESLKSAGYLKDGPMGLYGPVTQEALREFASEYGLPGDGSTVTPEIIAALSISQTLQKKNLPDLGEGIELGMTGSDVRQAQKLLRYLGYYRGRTDGTFDQDVKEAVASLQIAHGIVKSTTDPFAGRIGPATRSAILQAWKVKVVAEKAKRVALRMQVADSVRTSSLPQKVLAKGDRGADVSRLQRSLRDLGYLSPKDVTGTYGTRTESALKAYQLDRAILKKDAVKGVGVFGPATRTALLKDMTEKSWQKVRAEGVQSVL